MMKCCKKTIASLMVAGILAVTFGCGEDPGGAADESVADGAEAYEVKGRVRSIAGDRETITIEHEEIPGVMPAMTMPFYLADPALAKELEAGDAIGFRYVLRERESFIDRINRLDDSAVSASPAGREGQRVPDPRIPRLEAGDLVPAFRLVNQDDEPFHLNEFGDRAVLMTFIFTRCPVPDFCPLMSTNFETLQQRIAEHPELNGEVQLLSVTIDPENDTPEVLENYAARYTDDTDTWTFATASRDRIDEVTTRFSVYIEDNEESASIDHILTTALIGPDLRLKKIWRGNAWSPDEVLAEIEKQLHE